MYLRYGQRRRREVVVSIRYGDIAEGITSVALLMGLDPKDSVFLYSTASDLLDSGLESARRQLNLFPFRFVHMFGYMPRDCSVENATGIFIRVPEEMCSYFDSVGLAPRENIIFIGDFPTEPVYEQVSVSYQLKKTLYRDQILREKLSGKTLVSFYSGGDEDEIARQFGVKLVMSKSDQIPFGSKVELRKNARLGQYNVPFGVEIETEDELENKIAVFVQGIKDVGLDPYNTPLWVKLESQSSGEGILHLEGLTESSIEKISDVNSSYAETLFVKDGFLPFVIEIDVSCLPYTEVVANIGVQVVISYNTVTFVGSTIQKTKDGRYIGCEINSDLDLYSEIAMRECIPCLVDMCKRGYRGFVNLDILISFNKKNEEYTGYIIDPNTRFSGGTPLLSICQYSEKMTGTRKYGIKYFNFVRHSDSLFSDVIRYCGDSLYRGERSGYSGVIPLHVNGIVQTRDGKSVATVMCVGDSSEHVWEMYNKYKTNVRENLP